MRFIGRHTLFIISSAPLLIPVVAFSYSTSPDEFQRSTSGSSVRYEHHRFKTEKHCCCLHISVHTWQPAPSLPWWEWNATAQFALRSIFASLRASPLHQLRTSGGVLLPLSWFLQVCWPPSQVKMPDIPVGWARTILTNCRSGIALLVVSVL